MIREKQNEGLVKVKNIPVVPKKNIKILIEETYKSKYTAIHNEKDEKTNMY